MVGYEDGYEQSPEGTRPGLGDLVDKTIRFYSSNHEAIDSEREPEYSQYRGLVKELNEATGRFEPRHLFQIHAMSGRR